MAINLFYTSYGIEKRLQDYDLVDFHSVSDVGVYWA